MVFDSADALDDSGDESYLNLKFFLPDAPTVDVIITTRHIRVAEMTTLTAVEVEEIETTEAVELFQKCTKLQSPRPDVNGGEVLQIVAELRKARAGDYAGGILCGGDTTVEAGHPLVSTGVSRMTATQWGSDIEVLNLVPFEVATYDDDLSFPTSGDVGLPQSSSPRNKIVAAGMSPSSMRLTEGSRDNGIGRLDR